MLLVIKIHSLYSDVSKQGLGNNLFQYCWARNIAEIKGYALFSDPITGFPETYIPINGNIVNNDFIVTPPATQIFDMNSFYNHVGGIIVYGYSQRYEHYQSFKDKIRSWLYIDNEEYYEKPNNDDIVLNVRLGDYVKLGWSIDMDYYLNILKKETYNKAIIITDEPNHPELKKLTDFGCIIKDHSIYDKNKFVADFIFVKHASKTIIANSTFSWWAAFLGTGIVYFPCFKFPWISNPTINDIDLRVIDEDRYRFILGETK